jgi:hypothetical protein
MSALAIGIGPGCSPANGPIRSVAQPGEPRSITPRLVGRQISTTSVDLVTTLDDQDALSAVSTMLDGVYAHLSHALLPPTVSRKRIRAYFLSNRAEWQHFIIHHTGDVAPIYLQITRGGFSRDDYLAFRYLGSQDTLVVAAHEMLHAFFANHFRQRPPAFLEEGLATTLESAHIDGAVVRFRLDSNPNRLAKLRSAYENDRLIPLSQMLSSDAGQFLASVDEVDVFYSQAWAFVRMLRSDPQRSRQLDRLLSDAAVGEMPPLEPVPLMERYFETDFASLNQTYRLYIESLQD